MSLPESPRPDDEAAAPACGESAVVAQLVDKSTGSLYSAPTNIFAAQPRPQEPPQPRPWGFWMTWLWMLPISLAVVLMQTVVVLAYVFIKSALPEAGGVRVSVEQMLVDASTNGLVLSLYTIATAALVFVLLIPPIWLRRMKFSDYLGLDRPALRQIAICSALVIGLVAVTDTLTALTGRDVVSEFTLSIHATTVFAPLLWLALVVAAPLGEELVFRGFLLAPRGSRLVALAGLIGSSLVWAIVHLQYEPFGIATIFCTGLLLGAIRIRTGSTTLTILMHALMNAIATAELYLKLYLFD